MLQIDVKCAEIHFELEYLSRKADYVCLTFSGANLIRVWRLSVIIWLRFKFAANDFHCKIIMTAELRQDSHVCELSARYSVDEVQSVLLEFINQTIKTYQGVYGIIPALQLLRGKANWWVTYKVWWTSSLPLYLYVRFRYKWS